MTPWKRIQSKFVTASGMADEKLARLLARRRRLNKPGVERVLIVSPALQGSLGDEAMIQAIATHLRNHGARKVGLLVFSSGIQWGEVTGIDRHEMLPGALDHFGLTERAKLARIGESYDASVMIGADVLDGHYSVARSRRRLAMFETLGASGLRLVVAGFSVNGQMDAACHSDLRHLSRKAMLCLRDPESYARLDVPPAAKALTADTAFLLTPGPRTASEATLIAKLAGMRDSGTEFFACNINAQVFAGQHPTSLDRHVEAIAEAVASLKASGAAFNVLLMPHDRRGALSDAVLLQRLEAALRSRGVAEISVMPSDLCPSAVKAIAGLCSAALTGRMHFAIACLGMGVPVLGIPYQGKFEGLFELFEMPASVLDPLHALDSPMLAARLLQFWRDRERLAGHVRSRNAEVADMAGKFVQWL